MSISKHETLPLTGQPKDVLPKAIHEVDSKANDRYVREFYIGRTTDPIKRASAHGNDNIAVIYQTESINHAIEVEEALLKCFRLHPKFKNVAIDGRGGVSEEDGNYVYVATWKARKYF